MQRRIQQAFVTSPLNQSEHWPVNDQQKLAQRARQYLRVQIGNSIRDLPSQQLVPQAIINLGLGQQVSNAKQLVQILKSVQTKQQLQSLQKRVRNIAREIKKMQKVKGIVYRKDFRSKVKYASKSSHSLNANVINSRLLSNYEQNCLQDRSGLSSKIENYSPKEMIKKAITEQIQHKKKWESFYDFSKIDKIVAENLEAKKQKARVMNKRVQTIFQKQKIKQRKTYAQFQFSKLSPNTNPKTANGKLNNFKKHRGSLKFKDITNEIPNTSLKKLDSATLQQRIKSVKTRKSLEEAEQVVFAKPSKETARDYPYVSVKNLQQRLKTSDPIKYRNYCKTSQKLSRSNSNSGDQFQNKLRKIRERKAFVQSQYLQRQIRFVIEKQKRILSKSSQMKQKAIKKRIESIYNPKKSPQLNLLQSNQVKQELLKQHIQKVNLRKEQFLMNRTRKIQENLHKQQLKRTILNQNRQADLFDKQNADKKALSTTVNSIKSLLKDKRQYKIKQLHKRAQEIQSYHMQANQIKKMPLSQLQKRLAQLSQQA